MNSILAAYCS